MTMDLRIIYNCNGPTGHIYNGNGPSGHIYVYNGNETYGSYIKWQWTFGSYIYMYNGNETFGSDTMESRADVRLDLSQNNKLNRVAYAYVYEIVSNICWLLLYILVKEYIDI